LGTSFCTGPPEAYRITDAGLRLQQRLKPAFAEITSAVDEINEGAGRTAGTGRFTVRRVAAQMLLVTVMGQFLANFPDVQ
jgi:DNA-binding transcriptional LysR family regulator